MLRKLVKHEFRATGRVMLPMYLILLVTAVGANISGRGLIGSSYWILDTLAVLVVMAFGFAIAGACLLAFLLMIQRFYKNLLQDEGYLMMTLPVSIHQHIWAKLIVSTVWFILTILAIIISAMVVAYDVGFLSEFFNELLKLLHGFLKLNAGEAVNGVVVLIEGIALIFLAMAAFSLQFYAALAVGHSFANHKLLTSVGCFFAIQFVMQFATGAFFVSADRFGFFRFMNRWSPTPIVAVHVGMLMLMLIAGTVIYGAIFYGITTFFLKRRLNLE